MAGGIGKSEWNFIKSLDTNGDTIINAKDAIDEKILRELGLIDSNGNMTAEEYYLDDIKQNYQSFYKRIAHLRPQSFGLDSESSACETKDGSSARVSENSQALGDDDYTVLETDDEGREVSAKYRGDDNKYYVVNYEYDENGNLLRELTKSPTDKNFYSERNYSYKFDKSGNCVQQTVVHKSSPDDETPIIEEFDYDEDTSLPHYNDNNQDFVSKTMTYWHNGHRCVEKYERGANLTNRVDKGVPDVQIEYDENGNILKTTQYSFDENGVISRIKITDGDGEIITDESDFEIDGNFRVSIQGLTGDCYLLASIGILSKSKQGLKILRDNVKHDTENKLYTVTFPGIQNARENLIAKGFPADKVFIQTSYTVTEQELLEAAQSLKYSRGDRDVLLYELAYEKYRQDAARTARENNIEGSAKYIPGLYGGAPENEEQSNLEDGSAAEVFYMLTGKKSDTYERYNNPHHSGFIVDSNTMEMQFEDSGDNEYVNPSENDENYNSLEEKYGSVTSFGSDDEQFSNIMRRIIEESKLQGYTSNFASCSLYILTDKEKQEYSPHQFRIIAADENRVVLENPWNTDVKITVPIEQFKTGLFDLTFGQYTD